jgi:hypothetical protein
MICWNASFKEILSTKLFINLEQKVFSKHHELDIGHIKKEFGELDLVIGKGRIGGFIIDFYQLRSAMDNEENT